MKTLGQIAREAYYGNHCTEDFAAKPEWSKAAQAVADHVRGECAEKTVQLRVLNDHLSFENSRMRLQIEQLENERRGLVEFGRAIAPQFKFKVGDVVYDLDQDSNSICKLVVNSVMVDKHGVAYLFEGHSGSALESDCLTEEQAIEWIKEKSDQPTAII